MDAHLGEGEPRRAERRAGTRRWGTRWTLGAFGTLFACWALLTVLTGWTPIAVLTLLALLAGLTTWALRAFRARGSGLPRRALRTDRPRRARGVGTGAAGLTLGTGPRLPRWSLLTSRAFWSGFTRGAGLAVGARRARGPSGASIPGDDLLPGSNLSGLLPGPQGVDGDGATEGEKGQQSGDDEAPDARRQPL